MKESKSVIAWDEGEGFPGYSCKEIYSIFDHCDGDLSISILQNSHKWVQFIVYKLYCSKSKMKRGGKEEHWRGILAPLVLEPGSTLFCAEEWQVVCWLVGCFYLRSENSKAVQSGVRKKSVLDRGSNKHNSKKQMRKTVAPRGKEQRATLPKARCNRRRTKWGSLFFILPKWNSLCFALEHEWCFVQLYNSWLTLLSPLTFCSFAYCLLSVGI